jgi:metallo-beta-lactamase family protein
MNGAEGINVLGDGYDVRAEVSVIKSLSAHGDSDDLVKFLSCQDASLVRRLFLVHGEINVQEKFKRRLGLKGFEEVGIPALHEEFEL